MTTPTAVKPQHTPTPWDVDSHSNFPDQKVIQAEGSRIIAVVDDNDETDRANAAFIVRAVNCHEELVNTLHHLLNQPELLTDDFYRKQIKEMLVKAEANV